MFEQFYGFIRSPFTRDIPTDELYKSVMMDEMVGRLLYAAERQLFTVVTGDCGVGKTTMLRCFINNLNASRFRIVLGRSKMDTETLLQGSARHWGCS